MVSTTPHILGFKNASELTIIKRILFLVWGSVSLLMTLALLPCFHYS